MNLFDILHTPFPRPKKSRRNYLLIFLLGLFCSLFIILYKPFGIENVNDQWYYNLAIVSIGIVFSLSILLVEWGIPSIIPKPFANWTLGKALIWYTSVIFIIGAVVFFCKSYLGGFYDFTWTEYFYVIGRTLVIAVTVSFFVLGLYQYLNRKSISLISLNENVLVTTQNDKSIRFNLKDILYIRSDDNYVDVHYESEGIRKTEVLRSSLKNIESQVVNPLSPIKRCHRRYLINIDHFKIEKKTSRSMTLVLKNHADEVPVSTKFVSEIKKLLSIRP